MPNTPKISVIVPVYNVEKYIRRCLDSISAQTFTSRECICIDDGTPDNSGKICDEYAQNDSRFVVIHKENGGVSSARNAGLDVARGEWITFVDSDDWIESCMFEKMLEDENADLIICGTKDDLNRKSFSLKQNSELADCENISLEKFWGTAWSKLYKRQIIKENNLYFPLGIKLGEDTIFIHMYIANINKNKVLYIKANLYNCFATNQESATHNISFETVQNFVSSVKQFEIYINEKHILDFEKSLFYLKLTAKNNFLFRLQKPRFALWRSTFPEINKFIFSNEKGFKFRLLYGSILLKMDFLASLILLLNSFIKNSKEKKANSV